jgi:hypothetical protein
MNVVTLEFKKCCQCGNRATKKLELLEFDERGVVGPAEPKHYCDQHFPSAMDEVQLRLLLDVRDAEIEQLRSLLRKAREYVYVTSLHVEIDAALKRSTDK